jgi:hypothetical protein
MKLGKNTEFTVLPKKNSIKIKDDVCWICGKEFISNNLKNRRTYHHAIQQRYNPIFNIQIPICQECHYTMNKEESIYKRYYNSIKGTILGLDKALQQKIKEIEK